MDNMKIAIGNDVDVSGLEITREIVSLFGADLTEIGAIIISIDDVIRHQIQRDIAAINDKVPVFVIVSEANGEDLPASSLAGLAGVIDLDMQSGVYYGRQIEEAATQYGEAMLPPFFKTLKKYVEMGNSTFACPGHQGGQFFKKHPAGRQLFDFFGENLFRSDMCNADVKLGDLLIHEGAAHEAQVHAAKVFNADKTYFVLNGTSSSNKVATNAILTKGDLVLFDRNNHKSNHHGALIQAGATPVYLETARNPFGFIGGIDDHCFEEKYIRDQIREIDPARADEARPFRMAIIQLGTYDGTIYNARQVVDRIGHLCDYILFDSAWVGYEQFIPMMKDCSPLLLELGPNDPGIIVTQSVHKQQAGFSQTSQIHKKDSHIKGQKRYCNHKRFNNAFMMHASTSPFYALFASLDVNAKMHEGQMGRNMWADCVETGVKTRKLIMASCTQIKPFIPTARWEHAKVETICNDLEFFEFKPGEKWHSFDNYGEGQYFVDPCKLLLTTPGIDTDTGEYADFGVPATILANFLRENQIIPEKCDLNSILFLLTPAEDMAKMQHLVIQLARFERLLEADAPLSQVLPNVVAKANGRYDGYSIRQLCQEMHDMYKAADVKTLQKRMFRKEFFPTVAMGVQDAHQEYMRGNCELVALKDIPGRTAMEGALPYPPGVLVVCPGEVWSVTAANYFLALEEGINKLPGFAPELQGVYLEERDGWTTALGYVHVE